MTIDITPTPAPPPGSAQSIVSAQVEQTRPKDDPLVATWFKRIKAAEKHWDDFHRRVRYNRALVRGIDDSSGTTPESPHYNKKRANLIKANIAVVQSKVYAKNPEMSAEPTNKGANLRKLCDTVSTVTQTMLEDAKLKAKAKRGVRAAMTCTLGILKVQYQRDRKIDPIIKDRIEDAQDNIANIESLLAQIEGDEATRTDLESKRRELEQAIAGWEAQKEVVASEGLVLDMVRTDRLLLDTAIDDILDYEQSAYMIEKIPMRRSVAMGLMPGIDLTHATTYKVGDVDKSPQANATSPYSGTNMQGDSADDPLVLVYEIWSKTDNTIYTLVDGIKSQFARAPYQPQYAGERWWAYFILPWGVVDGVVVSQSLVDDLEKLEVEHNETRDKFAELRRKNVPHWIASGDVREKDLIKKITIPGLGEVMVLDAADRKVEDVFKQAQLLQIDPAAYDTSPISYDIETVSGLQEAARSIVTKPKTATEASISDQSLGARVADFRDTVEDWLTEIAQYSSELCLLAMTPQQVEQIMGSPAPVDPMAAAAQTVATGMPPPPPELPYEWPAQRTPDTVFQLIQMKIRAGSTAAPNKLEMQESWTRALPLLEKMIGTIMAVDASGGDSTPYRELVKETAARFDESLDVDRFLPLKPIAPAMPAVAASPQIPGAMPGMPMPGGQPGQPPATLQ
ncbi:hypothetical protein O4H66_17280 [Comamonadaceae bacterium G21597-S1]|nr:hypothetical protein [Comamonadaceae bacterium G21597-S1]